MVSRERVIGTRRMKQSLFSLSTSMKSRMGKPTILFIALERCKLTLFHNYRLQFTIIMTSPIFKQHGGPYSDGSDILRLACTFGLRILQGRFC